MDLVVDGRWPVTGILRACVNIFRLGQDTFDKLWKFVHFTRKEKHIWKCVMFVTDIFHIKMKQIPFCGRKMTEKRARNKQNKNNYKGFGLFNVSHRQISSFNLRGLKLLNRLVYRCRYMVYSTHTHTRHVFVFRVWNFHTKLFKLGFCVGKAPNPYQDCEENF